MTFARESEAVVRVTFEPDQASLQRVQSGLERATGGTVGGSGAGGVGGGSGGTGGPAAVATTEGYAYPPGPWDDDGSFDVPLTAELALAGAGVGAGRKVLSGYSSGSSGQTIARSAAGAGSQGAFLGGLAAFGGPAALATAGGVAVGTALAAGALVAAASAEAEYAQRITDLSETYETSIPIIAALDTALQRNASTVSAYAAAQDRLDALINDALAGDKRAIEAFEGTGVSAAGLASQTDAGRILAVADTLDGLDRRERLAAQRALLGSTDLDPFLSGGAAGVRSTVEAGAAAGPAPSGRFAQRTEELGQNIGTIAGTLQSLAGAGASPIVAGINLAIDAAASTLTAVGEFRGPLGEFGIPGGIPGAAARIVNDRRYQPSGFAADALTASGALGDDPLGLRITVNVDNRGAVITQDELDQRIAASIGRQLISGAIPIGR